MKTQEEVRSFIVEKLKEKDLSMNAVSQEIGMNAAYLFKFITHQTPKRLPEMQRKRLAYILNVPEQELTDLDLSDNGFEPPLINAAADIYDYAANSLKKAFIPNTVKIDVIDATACCGFGTENFTESKIGCLTIPSQEFKEITNVSPASVKLIRAAGDSMEPTIKDGDRVWVDVSNNFFSSDGIYLIRIASSIAIKRIQIGPEGITVKSDNTRYEDFPFQETSCQILGKIIYIWNGKKV